MSEENSCRVRTVVAPDGTEIPIPVGGIGGVGLVDGHLADIRDDAEIQISVSENGYYVLVNNLQESNHDIDHLMQEVAVEGAITHIERLATQAFSTIPHIAIKAFGLFAGILVSLTTTSKLTKEVFIRATLADGSNVTYCLLL